MIPQEIIRRKRDGAALEPAEIAGFVAGLTSGEIGDAQVGAFAMAVLLRGMTDAETVALTLAMRDSGEVLDWRRLGLGERPVVDKHSTGGIGDKVSLVLAPLVAACGCAVPMISGRGLGHTGGTLDKLESIPGYRTAPDREDFARAVRAAGCAIIGQTDALAPADRRLYAIRDVTATVESLPLITASILSKKLAAGLRGLAMDVKVGSGAFMTDLPSARALAGALVAVANGAGLPTTALITDMDQVLGDSVGNALEVQEALDVLTGRRREPRLLAVTLALGVEMLLLAGAAATAAEARARLEAALDGGQAAGAFARMAAALGGPADLLERPRRHLPAAPLTRPVLAGRGGFLGAYDARALGLALIELGGGRTDPRQAIDPAVGLTQVLPRGERVDSGAPLCLLHARDPASADRAEARLRAALRIVEAPPPPRPLIVERIAAA